MLVLIIMIDMHGYVCMYVEILLDMVGLRGVGVLMCMISPEARDIWSLPYLRIMVPTCHNSDVFC